MPMSPLRVLATLSGLAAISASAAAQPAADPAPEVTEDEALAVGRLTVEVNEPVQRRFEAQLWKDLQAKSAYEKALADHVEALAVYEAERARLAALKATNDEERRVYEEKMAAYRKLLADWPKAKAKPPASPGH